MSVKCESCGKFRKEKDCFTSGGENNETWIECIYCCSPHDREQFIKYNRPDLKQLTDKGSE